MRGPRRVLWLAMCVIVTFSCGDDDGGKSPDAAATTGGTGGSASGGRGGAGGSATGGTGGSGTGGSATGGTGGSGTGGTGGSGTGGTGGSGTGGTGGSASLTAGNAPSEIARAYCQKVFECCTADERTDFMPKTVDACVTAIAQDISSAKDSVDDGRTTFDSSALATCLTQMRGMACPAARMNWDVNASACPYLTPKVAAGGKCDEHFECMGGYCAGTTATTEGTCTSPKKQNGTACEDDYECASGRCDGETEKCAASAAAPLCDL